MRYAKQTIRYGVGGLDLRRTSDLVDLLNCTVLTNAVRLPDGGWTSRFGQTYLATATDTPVHSITRAIDPQSGTTNFLWGAGTSLDRGLSGALSSIASGFSGDPLSVVPWRVAQSGESWMLVADSNKMVKVRVSDGLVLPIGLPVPASAVTTALTTQHKKTIENFESAASFAAHAGVGGGSAPTLANPAGKDGNCLSMLLVPGAATTAYSSFADKALTLDLTTYGGGVDATDDDYIHLWLRVDSPVNVSEIRVYFTTGAAGWTANNIPGTSSTLNKNGYYKAFRPSDSTGIVEGAASVAVAPTIVNRRYSDDGVKQPLTQDEQNFGLFPDPAITTVAPNADNTASTSDQQLVGAGAWTEWGSIGIPLRRGDFQPFGESPDWSTVTGLTVYVLAASATATTTIYFDQMYLAGGAGPDTGEPGTQKYDYVVTNFDTRTGAESNASATQSESAWLDALRRGITVTPPAYGDAAVRQCVYRRGGVLSDNWRYVGQNSADGGAFTDTLSDTEILTADTVPTDYFEAVPSVDDAGDAVLGQPVPYLWGPLQGIVFAAGDPNRPGSVYWCYPDNVDAWGANFYVDVSAPSEAMMGGFLLGSQSFAWSTQRLYALNVNFGDSTSVVSTITNCTRAPIAPWAYTVGQGVAWFCAYDGIFATDGGPEVNISDAWIRPLFLGVSANGLAPIDLAATNAIRLSVYQNELHVFYQDTNGDRQELVYHLIDKLWRHASFARDVQAPYADTAIGIGRLLYGGTDGDVYIASGTSDDGVAITSTVTTGDMNQGFVKSQKRYLDFTVDVAPNAATVTVTPLTNYGTVSGTPLVITGAGRDSFIQPIPSGPVLSTTLGLEATWSTASTPPVLYAATLTFELEPPQIKRWASLPTTHGSDAWFMVPGMYLTVRSNAPVTIDVTAYTQDGTADTRTYAVTGTVGAKIKQYIPFEATKGAMYSYVITSTLPFVLYPEDSYVIVQPWGTTEATNARLIDLANENSDAQSVFNAEAASTPGGA